MRILIVLENYWPHKGGVETLFQTLAEKLAKKGHEVDIVTHRLKGTRLFEEINGVNIHRVKCFDSRYLFTFLSIPKVLRLARNADVIHTTTFNGAGPAWLASKLLQVPCLITIHEVWLGQWGKLTDLSKFKALLHEILERPIFMLKYNRYVTVSKSTRSQLIDVGIPKENIEVIYNGVDYVHFNPKKYNRDKKRKELGLSKDFVCLSFSRLGPSKGLKYATKAVPELSKKIKNFKYLLILSKDKAYSKEKEILKEETKRLGYNKKVKILDPVPWEELPSYIKAADCVIVPSLAEGFGYTIAESCYMGTPVVASNTTSIPEVISNKHLLVPPKNSDAIAQAVINVSKKKYAIKPLKKFTSDDMVTNYLKIYKEITE